MSQVSTLRNAVGIEDSTLSRVGFVLSGVIFLTLMAQVALPIPGSPVPVTGQTLGALLIGTAYGASLGFTTLLFYLIAGVLGAPVFTSHSYGISHLTGATGGYLVGMVASTLLTGMLAGRKWDQKFLKVIPTMLIGEVIIFTFGLVWLQHVTGQNWNWVISKGFTPFIFGEILKIALAGAAFPTIWKLVRK